MSCYASFYYLFLPHSSPILYILLAIFSTLFLHSLYVWNFSPILCLVNSLFILHFTFFLVHETYVLSLRAAEDIPWRLSGGWNRINQEVLWSYGIKGRWLYVGWLFCMVVGLRLLSYVICLSMYIYLFPQSISSVCFAFSFAVRSMFKCLGAGEGVGKGRGGGVRENGGMGTERGQVPGQAAGVAKGWGGGHG